MNESNDHEVGVKILPGVDLALWLRIVLALLLAAVVGGIALALD